MLRENYFLEFFFFHAHSDLVFEYAHMCMKNAHAHTYVHAWGQVLVLRWRCWSTLKKKVFCQTPKDPFQTTCHLKVLQQPTKRSRSYWIQQREAPSKATMLSTPTTVYVSKTFPNSGLHVKLSPICGDQTFLKIGCPRAQDSNTKLSISSTNRTHKNYIVWNKKHTWSHDSARARTILMGVV